jgi:hypothetical protein
MLVHLLKQQKKKKDEVLASLQLNLLDHPSREEKISE